MIVVKIILAKHKAAVTPINPKNGAEVGHVSVLTVIVDIQIWKLKGVDGLDENALNAFFFVVAYAEERIRGIQLAYPCDRVQKNPGS